MGKAKRAVKNPEKAKRVVKSPEKAEKAEEPAEDAAEEEAEKVAKVAKHAKVERKVVKVKNPERVENTRKCSLKNAEKDVAALAEKLESSERKVKTEEDKPREVKKEASSYRNRLFSFCVWLHVWLYQRHMTS